jgi:hypothetical protein
MSTGRSRFAMGSDCGEDLLLGRNAAQRRLAERDAGVRPGATTDEPAIAARPERNNLRQIPGGSDLRARGRQATARR